MIKVTELTKVNTPYLRGLIGKEAQKNNKELSKTDQAFVKDIPQSYGEEITIIFNNGLEIFIEIFPIGIQSFLVDKAQDTFSDYFFAVIDGGNDFEEKFSKQLFSKSREDFK